MVLKGCVPLRKVKVSVLAVNEIFAAAIRIPSA
jgi:hypothetical protein